MERSLTQRISNNRMDLSPPSPHQQDPNGDWLEPSEEFPILFGLLTARANAQQKTKEKQQQSRRRILRLNRHPGTPSPAANLNSVIQEPDSSIRENSESESGESGQNSSPISSPLGLSRKNKSAVRRITADDDDDVPSSTTNDFDLIPPPNSGVSTTRESASDSEGENPPIAAPPPRKRSRLEECLIMPRLEVMLSQGHGDNSYHRHLNNYRNRNPTPPMKPGNVQEKSITTNTLDGSNSLTENSCSIPTLNLRELLASSGGGANGTLRSHRGNVNIWKSHQFRFEKRKYTRKFRDPETNDLMEIADDEARPFQCPQCDLKFKRSYHLTRHLTIHSREERFFCQGCKVACFQRKDNLLAHMRKCCPPSDESLLDKTSNLKPTSLLQLQLRGLRSPPNPLPYSRPFLTKDIINNIISNNPTPPKARKSHPEDPLSLVSSPNPKSWISLSEFMESAAGGAKVNETVDDDPVIGLDLEMVEISEVSPEESSSSSSFGTSEESLDFSTTPTVGNKKMFKSQSQSTKSLPPNDNIGVNLILRREMEIDQDDDDEGEVEVDEDGEGAMYPCGDCDAVFRNLHRLMKHSKTTHVAEVPTACN